MTASREQVAQALGEVRDPELGMSVADLGLIYDVHIDDARVGITMTLTAPGCPLEARLPEWIRLAVSRVPGVGEVTVTVTFDPPWTPDRIAPPAGR